MIVHLTATNILKSLLTLQFVPCHRKKSRSYIIAGKQFPICARCTSILLGYLFTPILLLLELELSLFIGILLNIPMIIDGYTQLKKWRKSTNFLRTITGLLSGLGQSIIIVWMVNTIVKFIL